MTITARSLALAGLLLAAALVVAPRLGTPAEAQAGIEQILAYDVAIEIRDDGDLLITEIIDYDFGPFERHGIFREIPVRFLYDDANDRLLRIHDIRVLTEPGTPNDLAIVEVDGTVQIRIGNENTYVEGQHTYRIEYRVEGALNRFDDHDELFYNAIGPGWPVPVHNASISITAPAGFSDATCYAGPEASSLACDAITLDGNVATVSHDLLVAGGAITPVVALSIGAVAVPPPILEGLPGTFSSSAATVGEIEQILSYDVAIEIRDDGDLLITEVIDYDFGPSKRRGIFREIPVRFHYDDTNDRLLRIHDVRVSASAGTPDDVTLSTEENIFLIRIGDENTYIEGQHTYRIEYRVEGALNPFDDHDELFYNAIGPGWPVPVHNASISIAAPAPPTDVACYAGQVSSRLACDDARLVGDEARVSHAYLSPGGAITPVVALPLGAVDVAPPILEARRTLQRAFSLTPFTIAATAVLLIGALGTVIRLLWVHGRDQRFVGSVVDIAFGSGSGETQRVPLLESSSDSAIEFAPPEGALPGQMGTLVDELAHPLDVTATIIDLAVRSYLTIEEIEGEGWFAKDDWQLKRLKESDGSLHEYERELLDGLFEDGDDVMLSDLKTEFVTRLKAVQDDLYRDVVAQGWFRRRPDQVRSSWVVTGVITLVVGVVATVLLAMFTTFALLGIPIAVAGLLIAIASNAMPRRTAKGTGMMRRVLGFQRAIATAERDTARWAEEAGVFSKYLPYAIVFGLTDRWAKAFEGLDAELTGAGTWYVSRRPFTTLAFASMIGDFSTTTAGTIVSTPASSGSSGFGGGGFAGGGMGGGGGGSW